MDYHVKRIKSEDEIMLCEQFQVEHFQWVDGPKPEVSGYMGYIKGKGLYVEMTCREKEPKRDCKDPEGRFASVPGSRVCDDSAMEIFIGFPDKDGAMTADSLYLNFEINGNGVMYGKYGHGRKNRSFLPPDIYEKAAPGAVVEEHFWKVHVLFPEDFLKEISGVALDDPETALYCNFYKISETPEIEHYASFSEVGSSTPNFHMPQYFARAVIVD
ncbi:MAG: carbohydrate-binding family 9-like protein [Eubacteriales bacterium]|nr:carbohydrate-binding family 9-like protein [Eubacteriales bacterium]